MKRRYVLGCVAVLIFALGGCTMKDATETTGENNETEVETIYSTESVCTTTTFENELERDEPIPEAEEESESQQQTTEADTTGTGVVESEPIITTYPAGIEPTTALFENETERDEMIPEIDEESENATDYVEETTDDITIETKEPEIQISTTEASTTEPEPAETESSGIGGEDETDRD